MQTSLSVPAVVVGSGLAGMMTALQLSPMPVLLLTQGKLGVETSSIHAQGGIAAASREEKDSSDHVRDTLRAGADLCDLQVVQTILADGQNAIDTLEHYGIIFDHDDNGKPVLGLEGAHSHRRIFHIDGDATGKGIIETLSKAVRQTSSIQVMENASALRLIHQDNQIRGLIACRDRKPILIETSTVILATGGLGGLFEESTNPLGNFGQGLILAAEAGAMMSDLEFIQFHPTALNRPAFPRILISEAVRGEGAILVNDKGERFLAGIDGQELAPRDVVARAIFHQIQQGNQVFLDARQALGERFASRFPTLDRFCQENGIHPATERIPIKPVEHFHTGGIRTDLDGQSSVQGLWAVGEVASTGLHGANRLASNSLLEATVMGMRTANAIARVQKQKGQEQHQGTAYKKEQDDSFFQQDQIRAGQDAPTQNGLNQYARKQPVFNQDVQNQHALHQGTQNQESQSCADMTVSAQDALHIPHIKGFPPKVADNLETVKRIMQRHLNIVRDEVSMRQAIQQLVAIIDQDHVLDLALNPAKIALMIAVSAIQRQESRGGHYRQDHPECSSQTVRSFLTYEQAYAYAHSL